MAQPVYYTGDTWPPITGTLKDGNGVAVDISTADQLEFVAKGQAQTPTTITGVAVNCTSEFGGAGDGTDGRFQYNLAAGDLAAADTYVPEIKVHWDDAATPPKIETFRLDSETFLVKQGND